MTAAAATFVRERRDIRKTAAAAIIANEIHQLPSGLAGYKKGLAAASTGDATAWETEGQVIIPKTVNVVFVDGQRVYWDRSAGSATYWPGSDRDFFIGHCVGDPAAADANMTVNLNEKPAYQIELQKGGWQTTVVKTVVGSTTVEVPDLKMRGGSAYLLFGTTAEAQKVDLLSMLGFAVDSNWTVEGFFDVADDGDAAAIDFNIGVANGTHPSDADAITESCFLHLDGNDLNLFAESDDGTTEVAATDTTVNIVLGTGVHFVIDGRNPADIQIIVNGALVLGATVFKLDAATGPLKLLAHLEKSADDTAGDYRVHDFCARWQE